MKLPKMPKIKIKKLTKIQKIRLGQVGAILVYTAGVVTYGVLNYIEGQEAQWKHLKDSANEAECGSVIFRDGDDRYWMAGRDRTENLCEQLKDMVKKEDEDEDS